MNPDAIATWVAALVTVVVLGGLFGERRLFGLAQHLLAGLATGYLALIVLREVIAPRLLEPLAADPVQPGLWLGLGLVGVTAGAAWLPRRAAAIPFSLMVGALAAFALGGAVVGTLLPQLAASLVAPIPSAEGIQIPPLVTETAGLERAVAVVAGIASLIITVLVLVGFIRGTPRGRLLGTAGAAGRWLLIGGVGAWLGFLIVSRLWLLLDRLAFLLIDWLGLAR